jgi:CRISPR-associated endoribonuclease Cas6
MLLSALISIAPVASGQYLEANGRFAQAWLLSEINRHAPELSAEFHMGSGLRPYTVSGLMDSSFRILHVGEEISAQTSLYLRITSMSAGLSELMIERILPGLPAEITLNQRNLRILEWTISPSKSPWAGYSDYQSLRADSQDMKSSEIRMEFASPTAFSYQGEDISLPVPSSLLRSWWQNWNTFCPDLLKIDPAWPLFAEACVLVKSINNLHTRRWKCAESNQSIATGFVGQVSLAMLPKRRMREWILMWPTSRQVMHTLSAFAMYCGTGHHTTIGMGQTRKIK